MDLTAGQLCSHDTLHAVDGLFGFYHCPACGTYFNLQLLNIISHTREDLAAMAQRFTQALSDNQTQETATHGVPRHNGD